MFGSGNEMLECLHACSLITPWGIFQGSKLKQKGCILSLGERIKSVGKPLRGPKA